ncbi:MAG: S1-like domain-containing RNA-binding protein [Cytophagales bacterium]|nr:S1-like domain-containing RNA-binding protein [Cytophagales bacterium]
MIRLGDYNTLQVQTFSSYGVYLVEDIDDRQADRVLLPNKYVPEGISEGDSLEVFVYTDSEDRIVATTLKPEATVGEIAALYVKDINKYGAFLDWGLEKDLFVPYKEQEDRLRVGHKCIVRLCLDHRSKRIIGTTRIRPFLNYDEPIYEKGQEVELLIFREHDLGFLALINHERLGMIYRSDIYERLTVGDERKGFVKQVRPDGKIDLSLRREGYKKVEDTKDVIVDALIKAGGKLPYNDKTDPETIRRVFKMSKKNFKMIIGSLYKAGLIEISDKGIKLILK